MSLDKQIKEIAEKRVRELVRDARDAVAEVIPQGVDVTIEDLARLVSGHKDKTVYNHVVKQVSNGIASEMLSGFDTDRAIGKASEGASETD